MTAALVASPADPNSSGPPDVQTKAPLRLANAVEREESLVDPDEHLAAVAEVVARALRGPLL